MPSEPEVPLADISYPLPQGLSKKQLQEGIENIRKDILRTKETIVDDFSVHLFGESSANKKENEEPNKKTETDSEKDTETGQDKTPSKTKEEGENIDWDSHKDIWKPPKHSIPIRADVRNFDFEKLIEAQVKLTGRKFDVIMTDPPWQLATSNPTRGVAIGYQQLGDSIIEDIPFPKLQDNGFIFIWVINAKYRLALHLLEKWGYELVDEVVWVKTTVNRRLAKSHGFYLQHAKETCLVGRKGSDPIGMVGNKFKDVIFAERRGQSQKPVEIYEMIEQFVPNGTYLEVFGRRNNLRDHWCTIGNEL